MRRTRHTMKSKILMALIVFVSSTIASTNELKTVPLKKGDEAPFAGYLLPDKHFEEAHLAILELPICERRLKDVDCADSLEYEAQKTKEVLVWGGVSLAFGILVGAVLIPKD